MQKIETWLNQAEFDKFCRTCKKLQESQYEFVKKAVKERMAKTESILVRADQWILGTSKK